MVSSGQPYQAPLPDNARRAPLYAGCHAAALHFQQLVDREMSNGTDSPPLPRASQVGSIAPMNNPVTLNNPVTFVSTCPACGHSACRTTRRALVKLLETNHTIDAYCITCDVLWPVSSPERVVIARAIAADHGDASPAAGNAYGLHRPPAGS